MNFENNEVNIYDLCEVERAKNGKLYHKGVTYAKLSAADEEVYYLEEDREIESRYVVFIPKGKMNTRYLHIAIQKAFPHFLHKYKTTINLQIDSLRHFYFKYHTDAETQKYIVQSVEKVETEIELVKELIEREKEAKRWYLSKMLC